APRSLPEPVVLGHVRLAHPSSVSPSARADLMKPPRAFWLLPTVGNARRPALRRTFLQHSGGTAPAGTPFPAPGAAANSHRARVRRTPGSEPTPAGAHRRARPRRGGVAERLPGGTVERRERTQYATPAARFSRASALSADATTACSDNMSLD